MGACCMYKLLACVEIKQRTNCGYNNALGAAAQCCMAAAVRSAV